VQFKRAERFKAAVLQLYTIDDGELARAIGLAIGRRRRPPAHAVPLIQQHSDFLGIFAASRHL
jgi:hypothetical protein